MLVKGHRGSNQMTVKAPIRDCEPRSISIGAPSHAIMPLTLRFGTNDQRCAIDTIVKAGEMVGDWHYFHYDQMYRP